MSKNLRIISLILICTFLFTFICACSVQPTVSTTIENSTYETIYESTEKQGTETTNVDPITTENITTQTTQKENVDVVGKYEIVNDGEFNSKNIVFQFGCLSDTHQTGKSDDYSRKLKSAFAQLKEISNDSLNAICIAGDLTDHGNMTEFTQVKKSYEEYFTLDKTPFIYTTGNHDASTETGAGIALCRNVLGRTYFANDVDKSMLDIGNRHCVVDGYHFVCVTIEDYNRGGDASVSDKTLEWLDKTLKEITDSEPDKPVFVLVHAMIYDTCYGSTLKTATSDTGMSWYTTYLTSTLEKYPQVVTFSGHLHFPLNDEKSIMQTSFTSLGCGSVRYMAIENGGYENMKSATVMNDCEEYSQGLLIQIDDLGRMRFVRMDFYNGATIKKAWIVEPTKADGSHLTKYTKARENNPSPFFDDSAYGQLKITNASKSRLYSELSFDCAKDDDLIHHYILTIYNETEEKMANEHKILADFYKHPTVEQMTNVCKKSLAGLMYETEYTIKVVAIDSWDNESEPLIIKIKTTTAEQKEILYIKEEDN